jgi:hypothetical protein
MERVAIVAHLKEGSEPRAAELIAKGPPFNLAETGIVGHSVYLSASEVVFVFEGHQVEWIVDEPPRIAREKFGWDRHQSEAPTPEAMVVTRSWS